MRWTKALIENYSRSYCDLKEYNILPWEVTEVIGGQFAIRGEMSFRSPFETQAIMNADFDIAIDRIGRGHWTGNINGKRFVDFKYFGKFQRVVIAVIYGIEDYELEGMGFRRVGNLRSIAYRHMLDYLNDENYFEPKDLTGMV